MSDLAFQQRVGRVSDLVEGLEQVADPAVRAKAKELAGIVMELHAAGLERVMDLVSRCGAESSGLIDSFTRDPLVSSLLVLHDIHPVDFETRVRGAVKGANAELVGLEGGRVRISVAPHREAAALEALEAVAPDAVEITVEHPPVTGFVPLAALAAKETEAAP